MKTSLGDVVTFVGAIVVGCGAAIAIASAAAVSEAALPLRVAAKPSAVEVVRLEPVVVTVSKDYFDAVRNESLDMARGDDGRKVTRG